MTPVRGRSISRAAVERGALLLVDQRFRAVDQPHVVARVDHG